MRYFLFTVLFFHGLIANAQQADSIPSAVQRILEAYPDQLKGYEGNFILWKDGSKMHYDDGRVKTEEEAFDSTDLEDQMNALWRPILGTQRMSPHSFGIAIDINTPRSEYWKWDHRDNWQLDSVEIKLQWHNSIPLEIVEIFERHGFIWGGKWFHYDTMHFEYRPEMLPATKRRAKKNIPGLNPAHPVNSVKKISKKT